MCTPKSDNLKLSHYLAEYLLRQKELTLAGIGHFRLETPTGNAEFKSPEPVNGEILFREDPAAKTDPELVAYIAFQSGKMKSLAAADLDSYLELARQFLNIGKSFWIEGIGTLSKNQSGHFTFSPEPRSALRGKELEPDLPSAATGDDSFSHYEEMFSSRKKRLPVAGRIAIWATVVLGLVLTVWGGYIVYKKNQKTKNASTVTPKDLSALPDTGAGFSAAAAAEKNKDSVQFSLYKFIIEEAFRNRALSRYANLKNYGVPVEMETADSVRFKIFFRLQALPSDTARLRDSLARWYSPSGKAYIEQ